MNPWLEEKELSFWNISMFMTDNKYIQLILIESLFSTKIDKLSQKVILVNDCSKIPNRFLNKF